MEFDKFLFRRNMLEMRKTEDKPKSVLEIKLDKNTRIGTEDQEAMKLSRACEIVRDGEIPGKLKPSLTDSNRNTQESSGKEKPIDSVFKSSARLSREIIFDSDSDEDPQAKGPINDQKFKKRKSEGS